VAVYTVGIWTVEGGREADFIRAWQNLADRTKSDFPDETATLLRDHKKPNLFISFGPWESLEQIEQWRQSDTFKELVGKIRELLDDFAPHTLDVVGGVE
jgi:heme-degrading monooxygenase HmoA